MTTTATTTQNIRQFHEEPRRDGLIDSAKSSFLQLKKLPNLQRKSFTSTTFIQKKSWLWQKKKNLFKEKDDIYLYLRDIYTKKPSPILID
jgi:hypothetical protein